MQKISIIIPAYNCESTIQRCLTSILKQNYKNYEIVIVNDGSTDNTFGVLSRFCKEYKMIKIYNKDNSGPGIARKYGLDRANGDYVIFIDADDYIDSNMLSSMVGIIENPNIDIVQCGYYKFIDGKNYEKRSPYIFLENPLESFLNQENVDCYLWNKLIRRELLMTIEFPNAYMSEDHYVLLQCFEKAKVFVNIDLCLYYYVENAKSLCNENFNLKKLDTFITSKDLLDKYSCNTNIKNYLFNYISFYSAYYYCLLANDDSNEFFDVQLSLLDDFNKYFSLRKINKFITMKRKIFVLIFSFSKKIGIYVFKKYFK